MGISKTLLTDFKFWLGGGGVHVIILNSLLFFLAKQNFSEVTHFESCEFFESKNHPLIHF